MLKSTLYEDIAILNKRRDEYVEFKKCKHSVGQYRIQSTGKTVITIAVRGSVFDALLDGEIAETNKQIKVLETKLKGLL